jgi:hypothetical protein
MKNLQILENKIKIKEIHSFSSHVDTNILEEYTASIYPKMGYMVPYLVEDLCYEPQGHGFDS